MADHLTYAIVCPTEEVANGEAQMVTIPGSEGMFGVLAGHAPFLTTVSQGFVLIDNGQGQVDKIHVRGGFAEVNAKGLMLVVEGAIALAGADRKHLQSRLEHLSEAFGAAGDDEARVAPLKEERDAVEMVLSELS